MKEWKPGDRNTEFSTVVEASDDGGIVVQGV